MTINLCQSQQIIVWFTQLLVPNDFCRKKHFYVNMPKCISEYNLNMGGVDMLDKQVSLYRTCIRGKK